MSGSAPEGAAAGADRFTWAGGEVGARRALQERFRGRLSPAPELRLLTTFRASKRQPVFDWFDYKQGFSAGLVEQLVGEWGLGPQHRVLDPFSGGGTTLLAARRRGLGALGVELLPSPALAAAARLGPLDARVAERLERAAAAAAGAPPAGGEAPADVVLLAKAFTPPVLEALWGMAAAIHLHRDAQVRALLMLALFSVLEPAGRALKDGNSIKIVDKKRHLDPVQGLRAAAARMAADIREGGGWLGGPPRQFLVRGDARALPSAEAAFHALVTSPPYLNRYDYVRLYSMEEAFGFGRGNRGLIALRRRQFRGHVETTYRDRSFAALSPAAREVCCNLAGRPLNNRKIVDMVAGYFEDLETVIAESARALRAGAPAAWVVGNVIHGGEHVPVDYLVADGLERNGFTVEAIRVTRFKGNSSQHMARHGRHPVRESIVVGRRM